MGDPRSWGRGPGFQSRAPRTALGALAHVLWPLAVPTTRVAALKPPAERSLASRSGNARARGLKPLGPVGAVGAALLAYENTTMVAEPMREVQLLGSCYCPDAADGLPGACRRGDDLQRFRLGRGAGTRRRRAKAYFHMKVKNHYMLCEQFSTVAFFRLLLHTTAARTPDDERATDCGPV